jgi:hypothetical protein
MRFVLGLAGLLASVPAWALPPAPTRQVANECRVLAYKEDPYQRPGKAKGSPARYEVFKDCVAKRSNSEAQQPESKQQ